MLCKRCSKDSIRASQGLRVALVTGSGFLEVLIPGLIRGS